MADPIPMTLPLHLTLPWEVLASVNIRTNPAGWGKLKGRQFLTAEYRNALEAARLVVAASVPRRLYPCPLEVEMRFFQPNRRRRDVGNYCKLIEDAMTGHVYLDDSQIQRQTWENCGVDRSRPRVEIRVEPLPSPPPSAASSAPRAAGE